MREHEPERPAEETEDILVRVGTRHEPCVVRVEEREFGAGERVECSGHGGCSARAEQGEREVRLGALACCRVALDDRGAIGAVGTLHFRAEQAAQELRVRILVRDDELRDVV